MNKVIIFILIIITLSFVLGETNEADGLVCKIKSQDCSEVFNAFMDAKKNWKEMPESFNSLFVSLFFNYC
ncbi:hypothetical protein DDB_G0293422 [Dictyostelium discoideum AX4]|uniref:Uncharacterized protein n=1 Tax=Dictyostelium discoideum TaxID=44689 RepID=Q54BU2_DICDI|nr:hypothetical protein DDB_G0293422 [Dictyostelium discoideum AX4]EAL60732.1 hypothetical protein DDB_G0293422 [Dictyostelium discoideum AX4]|eukprot:XP_629146.1 hypothetical protein DDB_G0293422 [Dictyostelium discoideum AX4]